MTQHRDFEAILGEWTLWSRQLLNPPSLAESFLLGKTNQSYLLNSDIGKIVLRINADNSRELGLNRTQEISFHQSASAAGISPALIYTDTNHRYMVKIYADGEVWHLGDGKENRSKQISEMAKTFSSIHSLRVESSAIDYLEVAKHYWQQIEFTNSKFGELILPLHSQIECFFQDFQRDLKDVKPCHHDPVVENLINTEYGLQILDWEYSTLGSPWFDLAVFSDSAKLNTPQTDELIERYAHFSGFVGDSKGQYKLALKCFYYLDLLWHCVQGYSINVLSSKLLRLEIE